MLPTIFGWIPVGWHVTSFAPSLNFSHIEDDHSAASNLFVKGFDLSEVVFSEKNVRFGPLADLN